MALAIIEFMLFEKSGARFKIDTGTNSFYKIKIGKSISPRNGIKWLDEITYSSPVQKSTAGESGNYLNTTKEILIPANHFDRESCYVQMFSFKTPDGRSPAFSSVVKVPVAFKQSVGRDYLLSLSKTVNEMTEVNFNSCRVVKKQPANFSTQESWQDLIINGLKEAAPALLDLLKTTVQKNGQQTAGAQQNAPAGVWNTVLDALLKGITGGSAVNATNASTTHSLSLSMSDNRFVNSNYSQPFIFGIDDALLASLAGPLLQEGMKALPQLLGAMNQQKQQKQAAANKLITDILAETNKRRMLEEILANQKQPGSTDVNQLMQLIQAAAAAAPAGNGQPAATTQAPATTQSLSVFTGYATVLSSKAMLVFDAADQVDWNGSRKTVYNKNGDIKLRLKLSVTGTAPSKPLPKAIIKFYFKDTASQKTIFEKTFRQKDIAANAIQEFSFTRDEFSQVPENKSVMAFAEMRWLINDKEIKALGSTELIFVNGYFLKDQGKPVSDEKEMTDMKVYRTFWNKIWEAPVLDSSKQGGGRKKYLWELNANLKYSFTLTAEHDSNGIQETRVLKGPSDKESMTEKIEGRMKAGEELSIDELNKLAALWDKQPVLAEEKKKAFKNAAFTKFNSTEFIYNVKLKGKAGERGMVWVSPVLKLFAFTLNKIKKTNDCGQVTEVEEEKVQFPLPVSARVIALKSA